MSDGQEQSSQLLVVGWDGADWRFLQPLISAGRLLNLQKVVEAGVSSYVSPAKPFSPTPAWCTVLTGCGAANHEVLTEVEPDGLGGVCPPRSTSRRRMTLWDHASNFGLHCGVIGFPTTCPADPIRGVVVSDYFCEQATQAGRIWKSGRNSVSPQDLFEELIDLVASPDDIEDSELNAFLPHGDEDSQLGRPVVAEIIAQSATVHNIATYLLQQHALDVWAIRYRTLLSLCRGFLGIESKLKIAPERARRVVEVGYEFMDMMLGTLMDAIPSDCHVMVVSPHGFDPAPNVITPPPVAFIDDHIVTTEDIRLPFEAERHFAAFGILATAGPSIQHRKVDQAFESRHILPTCLATLGFHLHGMEVPNAELTDNLEVPQLDAKRMQQENCHYEDPWFRQHFCDLFAEIGVWESDSSFDSVAVEQAVLRRLLHLGIAHQEECQFDDALRVFEELEQRDDSYYVLVHIVECLLALGRFMEADRVLTLRLERQSGSPPSATVALRAIWFTLQAKHSKATALLLRAVECDGDRPRLLELLGHSMLAEGAYDAAEDVFRRGLRRDSLRPMLHDGLAQCYAARDEWGLANFHRERASALGCAPGSLDT